MENNYVVEVDMDKWTPEQRQQHYLTVCAAAGLDPALGLLKYRHMDDGTGTGTKHLVLYATKDATNAIRDLQGIDIVALTDKVVNGAFVVTASAKNAKGRTDHAMGAASLEGKRGKALENAFALAQTRATRRVTLQMSGLPLIDESEVTNDGTTPIANADSPLDQIGTPVEVNSEAGIDITAPVGLTLKAPGTPKTSSTAIPAAKGDERLPNPATGLKLATTNMLGPDGATRTLKVPVQPAEAAAAPAPAPVEVATVSPQAQSNIRISADPAEASFVDAELVAPKQRRKRRTKAEMDAAKTVIKDVVIQESVPWPFPSASEQAQAELEPLPVAPASSVKVSLNTNLPTPEQMKVYVARLTHYREVVLPEGKMRAATGISLGKKLRAFFSVANNGQEDLMKLTVAQWEATFAYMDQTLATQGAKELVKIIETNIEALSETNS